MRLVWVWVLLGLLGQMSKDASGVRLLWSREVGSVSLTSAAVADIDNDRKPEIVFGTYFGSAGAPGEVIALRAQDGKVAWRWQTPAGPVDNAPAIADVNGDRQPEIFVGASANGPYVCLNGQGKVLWEYRPRQGAPEIFDSSGAIADLDGDKRMELVVGSAYFSLGDPSRTLYGYLHVLNASDGKVKFRKEFVGAIQSSPVLIDLNGDRVLDILVATYQGDRKLHARSGRDGAPLWSFEFKGAKDLHKLGAYHGPAVGDLEGDGIPEIVATSYDGNIYVLNRRGELKWQFTCQESIFHAPTLADLNGDKKREILTVDESGNLYALNHAGKQLWRHKEPVSAFGAGGGIVVANVSGDADLEVVYCTQKAEVIALNASNGKVLWRYKPPLTGSGDDFCASTPVIADFNGDGRMDIFFVAGRMERGKPADEARKQATAFALATHGKGPAWKMFRRDLRHTGCF